MRSKLILSAAALLLIAWARPAAADPIGIPGGPPCETCQGSIYWLEYEPTPLLVDGGVTVYEIVLRIDTTGYTGGGSNIDDVAFKVSPSLSGVALLDAPGGAGDWTTLLGGIDASGCDGNGGGFGCATSNDDTNATLPFAGVYEWRFAAGVPTGTLFTDPLEASIKARYVDDEGAKIGALVSEPITLQLVPEPGTALLLAFGLAGLAHAGSPRR